jgi:hypothetical protein
MRRSLGVATTTLQVPNNRREIIKIFPKRKNEMIPVKK